MDTVVLMDSQYSTVQSRQVFGSTLPEQLFQFKNEETMKNLRTFATYLLAKAHPSTLYAWLDPIS